MASAQDIAKYLIWLAENDQPESDALTHLRLQKLLYYVQGWSLATAGKPAFTEDVKAWKNGPVVRSVYYEYTDLGKKAIPCDADSEPTGIPEELRSIVISVWGGYKQHSASALWNMTHRERPWKETYVPNGPYDPRCDATITHELMSDFFTQQYDSSCIPGLELDRIRASAETMQHGKRFTFEEAFAD